MSSTLEISELPKTSAVDRRLPDAAPRPLALTAVQIAEAIEHDNLLYIACDERRAEALAAAAQAATPDRPVVFMPATDALPGDAAPATPANAGARVTALRRLRDAGRNGRSVACVVSAEATAYLYSPPEIFDGAPPVIEAGAPIDQAHFAATAEALGYIVDDRVDAPGEVAVRGDVIDIYPADAGLPVRIEIDDGRVKSIRSYDPVNQRTQADLGTVEIGRAAEAAVENGGPLLAHLAPGRIVAEPEVERRRERLLALAADVEKRGRTRVPMTTAELWADARGEWEPVDWARGPGEAVPRFVERTAPLAALARFVMPVLGKGGRLVLCGGTRDLRFLMRRVGKALKLEFRELASWAEALALEAGAAGVLPMPIEAGFRRDDMLVIAAADLLGSRAVQDGTPDAVGTELLGESATIRCGDVVVHEDHGIGVVDGLQPLPGDDGGDAIVLRYANDARRLVPVSDADRIWRYGADEDAVTLDTLDGTSWQKRRGKIDSAIAESATALAAIATERAARAAPVIEPEPAAYERFAAGFGFSETADQARAITGARDDLASGRPMDRLVIGDVGYGKTEVALRAAALVALAGGQVAVAAPTTVLVRQHLETFRRRFDGTGIVVESLSRLSSASQKKAVKAGLADGSVSIVVGTGAVAGKDVIYKALRLVVVDEEQRFGAADKAKLRGGTDVHLLTLSATPIPRTLQAALVGLQQLSIIATPPARRQPIRTTVAAFDATQVRTALMREKTRGGQSFVVVPRIEDLEPLARKLTDLVPEVTVIQVHGKLAAADLDDAMVSFADGRGDVLLATNIIEAGLDVPRANTMVVWRADRFGLAQLHQLRGRVGRGSRRGQVLLLTDGAAKLADRTMTRLRALQAFDQLGAGFAISGRDLEMRGAGDLLGDTQAGHMKLIGVELYQHLLEAALRSARGEGVDRWTPELNLGTAGSLPEDWIPEVEIRMTLYCRLARVTLQRELDDLEDELEDRFGPLPEAAGSLVALSRVRCLARLARVAKVDAGPAAIALTPRPDFAGDGASFGLVTKGERLLLQAPDDDRVARLDQVQSLLEGLAHED